MGPSLYQYQSLTDTHSIRLLSIRHDESKPHNLSLSLREVNLDSDPDFYALSYTWKSPVYTRNTLAATPHPERHFDVQCDDKTATISSNLFDFFQTVLSILHRPRFSSNHPSSSSPPTTPPQPVPKLNLEQKQNLKLDHLLTTLPIWIDALCINQTNPSEREHQVLLMHKIYSRAKHVLVWLGGSELDPRGSVVWVHNTFIPALAKATKSDSEFVVSLLADDPFCESRLVQNRLGGAVCNRWAASWLGFANFLDRHRWFDRGWVVQEVALGKAESISLLCGGTELSWVRLSAFSRFLHHTGWAQRLRNTLNMRITGRGVVSEVGSRRPIGWKIRSIEDIRRLVGAGPGEKAVVLDKGDAMRLWVLRASSLIAILRASEFEDHRDHVYGSLGMLSQLLPQGMESPIKPDYGMATEEVFTSVTATFIEGTKSLLELSQVEDRRHRRYHGLPSWVPDYSVHPKDSALPNMSESDLYTSLVPDSELIIPPPLIKGSRLIVHGIRIDTRGEATLHSWSDTPKFRDNLLSLLVTTTALHTTTLALDFFTALARGRLDLFIRSQTHPTAAVDSWDMGPSIAIASRTAMSRFDVWLSDLESESWLSATSQEIPFASLSKTYRANRLQTGSSASSTAHHDRIIAKREAMKRKLEDNEARLAELRDKATRYEAMREKAKAISATMGKDCLTRKAQDKSPLLERTARPRAVSPLTRYSPLAPKDSDSLHNREEWRRLPARAPAETATRTARASASTSALDLPGLEDTPNPNKWSPPPSLATRTIHPTVMPPPLPPTTTRNDRKPTLHRDETWSYESFMKFLQRSKLSKGRDVSLYHMASKLLGQLVQVDPIAPRVGTQVLQREVWDVLAEGMLCATEGGRLGLGPGSSLKGDEVWLLGGARAPVLLRRVGDHGEEGKMEEGEGREYRLVGEVYIPGVDVGRGLREVGTEKIETVVLV